MRTERSVGHLRSVAEVKYEEKRLKALRMIYDLKFTFDMEDLARAFLHQYVATLRPPASRHAEGVITERIMHGP